MSILKMNYLVYGEVVEDHGALQDALADGGSLCSRVRSLVEMRARRYGLSVVGI
jgi:hypothetical protein